MNGGSIDLDYQDGKYTATLTDTNGVLSEYDFTSSDSGVTLTKSGNTLTISTDHAISGTVRITASRNNIPAVSESAKLIAYGDPNLQDVVTGVENADRVTAHLDVGTPTGMMAQEAVRRVDSLLAETPVVEHEPSRIPNQNDVEFRDVTFTYPGGKAPALSHLSFQVPEGKTVALVGASGSGKTTAATLIPRFWDVQEGAVCIGGVPVSQIPKQELMNRIAFVFQDSRLLKASILENVRASRPDATREQVLEALQAAQCDDILEKLPKGVDTVLGTKGVYLSGGEQQRIALARAILKNAPIVLLDEATAFADPENEYKIQMAFERLTKGKTVLMIAHRLPTIQNADEILVLEQGAAAERGTHNSLMAQNGIYASMWRDYQTSVAWNIGKEGHYAS